MRLLYPTPGPGGLVFHGPLKYLTTPDAEMERFLSCYFGKIREFFPENHLRLCARKKPESPRPTFHIAIVVEDLEEPTWKRCWQLKEDAVSDAPSHLHGAVSIVLHGICHYRNAHAFGRYSSVTPSRVPSFNVGTMPKIEGFSPLGSGRTEDGRLEHNLARFQAMREAYDDYVCAPNTSSVMREVSQVTLERLKSWTHQLQTGELPDGVTPAYRRWVAYLRGGQPKTIFDA
jgi:hypothetical protein